MIVDFQSKALEKALRPKYDVDIVTYHPGQIEIELIGQSIKVSNDATYVMPCDEKKIQADEIAFDRQGMKYFRDTLADIMLRLKKNDALIARPPREGSREGSISDYLRPLFNMSSGHAYLEAIGQIVSRENPIPRDYLIFLPDPDSKHPSRDDIIRALVPFQKAQREALIAGWNEEISTIRIMHGGRATQNLILQ